VSIVLIIVFYYFIIVSCFHLSLASWLLFSNKVQFSTLARASFQCYLTSKHIVTLKSKLGAT